MGLSISGLAIYALTSNSTSDYLTHLTGGFWSSKILFYEYHSKGRVVTASYDQDSLVTKLLPLIELYDDQVESVRHYKSKLLMQTILFYHDFLVIKTPKWYYSLEKNSMGIILQRSHHLVDVVTRGQNNPRDIDPENYEELNLAGKFILRRIIQWILLTGELKEKYHVLASNCQSFIDKLRKDFAI